MHGIAPFKMLLTEVQYLRTGCNVGERKGETRSPLGLFTAIRAVD